MADPSTSRSSSPTASTSITHMAQDHLFSILLLLPVDSLLSFSLTCKRFKSLACSDSLWEAVCKRDWGHSCVDALKSCPLLLGCHHDRHQPHLPWMKIYKQVSLLDSVNCFKLSDPGDGGSLFPTPRASHSLNFVSDCLVLFGGGCEGGRHLDDTWIAYVGKDSHRMLKWQRINSGNPSGRFGHTCVVVGDYLVIFGGINDHGIRQNDTWVGKIECHETLGITLSWKLLKIGHIAPSSRGAHAACCIGHNMVIHGGIGLSGVRLGDTWVLDFSEDLDSGTWHEISTNPCPAARSGHTLTCVGGTKAVLFGGRGLGYEVLGDVWIFDLAEGGLNWVQMLYDLKGIAEGLSLPRVGHSATLILGGRLLIYGGEDTYRHRKSDFWVLDTKTFASIKLHSKQQRSIYNTNMWKRLKAWGYMSLSRSFHRACVDLSGRHLYVCGGMVDGLLQPAEASGLRFDGDFFVVELVVQL